MKFQNLFSKIREDKHLLLLLLIVCVIFTSHALYVSKTFQHPKWDEHIFLGQALSTYDEVMSPSLDTINKLSKVYEVRPPIYAMSIAFNLLFTGGGHTYKVALFTNVLFYVTSIVGIYFLARKFVTKTPSLIASLLFATYGFPLFYLHFVYSETATTTFVALTLMALAYSNGFTNKKYSILAGVFLFLGSITRWVTPIYVLGGLLVVILQAISSRKIKKKNNVVKNIGLFLITGIGLPLAIYYLPNYVGFSKYALGNSSMAPEWVESLTYLPSGLSNPFSIHSVMFYFNIFSQQTVYLFVLFCFGFLICIVQFKKYAFLLASFIIPYLFFTFFSVLKDDRYIVPIYPMMAIVSAVVIEKVKPRTFRALLIFAIAVICVLNLVGGSWGLGPLGKQGLKDIVLPEIIRHPRRIYLTTMVWPPIKDVTNAQKILSIVQAHEEENIPTVLNTYTVNPLELDVALSSLSLFEKRGQFYPLTLRVIDEGDYSELFMRLNQADFILVKQNKVDIADDKFSKEKTDRMIKIFDEGLNVSDGKILSSFSKVDEVYYPLDEITLYVYRKNDKLTDDDIAIIGQYLKEVDNENIDGIEKAINTYK